MTYDTALTMIGGREWSRGDEHHRIYFNTSVLLDVLGLEVGRYGTGNISSATLGGEKISNSRARKLEMDVQAGKLWWDYADEEFHARGFVGVVDQEMVDEMIAGLRQRADAIMAAESEPVMAEPPAAPRRDAITELKELVQIGQKAVREMREGAAPSAPTSTEPDESARKDDEESEDNAYAVYQADHAFLGIGHTPEEALADYATHNDIDDDEESDDEEEDDEDVRTWGRNTRMMSDRLYLVPITQALYDEIDGGRPDTGFHICATGLWEVGPSCALDEDGETPEEARANAEVRHDTIMRSALDDEERKLRARLAEIEKERRSLGEQTDETRRRLARAWEEWIETIWYAYKTHENYVRNNVRPADRARLLDPSPINVLETARRRGYAADWVTLAHMVRAIREIDRRLAERHIA